MKIIKEKNINPSDLNQNVIFNFHKNKALTMYTRWKSKAMDDSPEFLGFKRNVRLQLQIGRYMDRRFISGAKFPVYNKFKNYNYYDTLAGFVFWNFSEHFRK